MLFTECYEGDKIGRGFDGHDTYKVQEILGTETIYTLVRKYEKARPLVRTGVNFQHRFFRREYQLKNFVVTDGLYSVIPN